jgi:hypothetical protein
VTKKKSLKHLFGAAACFAHRTQSGRLSFWFIGGDNTSLPDRSGSLANGADMPRAAGATDPTRMTQSGH